MPTRRLAAAAAALLLASMAASPATRAQTTNAVSLTAIDTPYSQDFNTLASTGTSSVLPAGWQFAESGTNANTTYTAGTGSGNAGDTYSFGAAASADRAFGGLQSGSLIPTVGAQFSNDTGQTITSLDVAFTGEQWRLGTAGRVDRLDFQYSIDATSLTTGTWLNLDALDFVAPTTTGTLGALDGQAPANRSALTATVSELGVAPGSTIWIRWTDVNATGADDGLAVDDVVVTPRTGGAATLSINNVTVTEGNSGPRTATFTVTASTSAHFGATLEIATADGTGATPATVADGDYEPRSEPALELPAGATSVTFDVVINGDTAVEADETFFVRILVSSGLAIADGEGVGTIVNDDEPPPVTSDVVISQVYGGGGNSGATFTHDFVELFNPGTTAASLNGWSVQYASASGAGPWQVTPLTGSIAPGGYFLVRLAAGAGGTTPLPAPDASGSLALGASAGKVALQTTTTAIPGPCPLVNTADLVGYGAANCFEGTGPTAQASNTTAPIRKRGGCFDSENNNVDFSVGVPIPRNSAAPPRSCTPVPVSIHDIQGPGAVSPFAGLDVISTGIVTGVKVNGFFMQTPDASADANPATSQGLFVFTSATPAVRAGDGVSVRGTVGEFFALTQIEASLPGDVTTTATGVPLPSPVTLTEAILNPAGAATQLEPFEGMRMQAPSLTSIAPTDGFGEIATVLTGVTRPLREPGIPIVDPVPPDPTSGVVDCCIPRFDGNPERLVIDSEGLVGVPVLPVTSNVLIGSVTGPLDFSFGAYKLLPEATPTPGPQLTGIPVPPPAPDELTIAGFNIENFAGNETRQRKASLAIRQLMRSPDVIGHIEILDLATLQGLADRVNGDALAAGETSPLYQAVLIPTPPRPNLPANTQNVGFLVKTSRVRIDGVSQERADETFVNPANGQTEFLHDRPPLVLRATVDPNGANPRPVIVVVNHLRSFIDIELVSPEGVRVREKRRLQAESVAGLFQELQTLNPGVAIVAVGDYNAYQFSDGYTDPIATLKGAPTPDDQVVVDESPDVVDPNFVNLTDSLPVSEQYSFVFEGTPQALDHVLVNTVAAGYVQRYAVARGNADFPASPASLYADDPTRPERASDHDMPVAYFRFPPPTADVSVTMTVAAPTADAGGQVTYTVLVTNTGAAPSQEVVLSTALPAALGLVSCFATGEGVCGGTASLPTVTFPSLAPGTFEVVTLVGALGCGVPDGSSLVTTSTVSAATADPDAANNAASVTVAATNAAPSISGASVNRPHLLLPLHQKVPVTVSYAAADSCGAVTTTLSVTSNEPVRAPVFQQGLAGLTSPDWVVLDANHVLLRAERSVRGDGRVYTIRITATDEGGGIATQEVTVTVPRRSFGWFD